MAEGLTAEQIEFFEKNGYLTIPDFWTRETCDRLKRRAGEILEAFDVDSHRSVFTTNDQVRHCTPILGASPLARESARPHSSRPPTDPQDG